MKLILLDSDLKVSQILECETEQDASYWSNFFSDLGVYDGEVPDDISYQHRLVDGKLVLDETIELQISEVIPDPRDEIIAQQQADIDYLLMLVE